MGILFRVWEMQGTEYMGQNKNLNVQSKFYLKIVSIISLIYLFGTSIVAPWNVSVFYGSLFGFVSTILGVICTIYLLPKVISSQKRRTSYFLYFMLKILIFSAFFVIPLGAINYLVVGEKSINLILEPVNILVTISYSVIPIISSIFFLVKKDKNIW